MKPLLFLVCFLALAHAKLFSQVQETKQKQITLVSQNVYLHGGARATIGGAFGAKSRAVIQVQLPANTINWYYSFTTGVDSNSVQKLNLAAKIGFLLLSHSPGAGSVISATGLTQEMVESIEIPAGVARTNVYVLDAINAQAFINKQNATYIKGTENASHGSMLVDNLNSNICYIGLQNVSSLTAVNIEIEVVATVSETLTNSEVWSNDNKDKLYNNFYTVLKTRRIDDKLIGQYASCMQSFVLMQKTPASYLSMSITEQSKYLNEIFGRCVEKIFPKATPEHKKATGFALLGWKSFEAGDIDNCINLSKQALQFDSTYGWAKSNLGLCYLVKGDLTTASGYYVDAMSDFKNMPGSLPKDYLQGTIDKINNALAKYPDMKGADIIKGLYQDELSRY